MDRARTPIGRGSLVVASLALLVGLVAAAAWSGRVRSAQGEERDDLNLYLDASSAGWAEVTNQFFVVPESAVQTIGALVLRTDDRQEQTTLLIESIRAAPALDSAYIGFADGSFLFAARSDDPAAEFRSRSISTAPTRAVELTWLDADLNVVLAETDETDVYDPRERPWFVPIADGADDSWTDPYLFASSEKPGITYSAGIVAPDDGELIAVVGVDIRLKELSQFLDRLRPGENGDALVVDRDAQVIAASSKMAAELDQPEPQELLPLQESPELAAMIDRLAADGADEATLSSDGLRTTVARSAGAGNDWYLFVRALDSDFLGSASTGRQGNLVGIVSVAIAAATSVGLIAGFAARYLSKLRNHADHDELTGLLSRRAVKREIEDIVLSSGTGAVAIIDLDRFKTINDEHGHLVGDEVLKTVAHRIDEFALDNDAAAGRLGGDEFVVIASDDLDWPRLVERLARPVHVDGCKFVPGASIGVASLDSGEKPSVTEVLQIADDALFEAKRHGGGQHRGATPASIEP